MANDTLRVAFPLYFRDSSWIGGINYFHNLFAALNLLDPPRIEPILITGPSSDKKITNSFNASNIIISKWGDIGSIYWKVRKLLTLVFDHDYIFDSILKNLDISLFSHMGYLGKKARIPSLTWIPDFQEIYLPEFFSEKELKKRKKQNTWIVKHASGILLSSEYAREGLSCFSGEAAQNAYVLPFVASVPKLNELPSRDQLEKKYGNLEKFFFLPNQFWAHKNHEVVINALNNIVKKGKKLTIIATGNIHDYRQPLFGINFMRKVHQLGLEKYFRFLGTIPHLDLLGLMANSIGVINPSYFEGWSTTVEEAKSLGKQLIISDIPVHREQSPERVAFFNPDSANELAEILIEWHESYNFDTDRQFMIHTELNLRKRLMNFANAYVDIINKLIQ